MKLGRARWRRGERHGRAAGKDGDRSRRRASERVQQADRERGGIHFIDRERD
jgi:hypothetical protein